MNLDLAAVDAAIYSPVKRDAAGSAFRALLGAGADSVLAPSQLERYVTPDTPGSGAPSLPPRMLAIFRRVAPPRLSGLHLFMYQWFLEDDRLYDYRRIDGAIQPLADLYQSIVPIVLPNGQVITSVEITALSGQREDSALGLLVSAVTLTVRAAGPA